MGNDRRPCEGMNSSSGNRERFSGPKNRIINTTPLDWIPLVQLISGKEGFFFSTMSITPCLTI